MRKYTNHQVMLGERQLRFLERRKKRGTSMSQTIREALDEMEKREKRKAKG